jgi:LysM repeat protein
VAAVIAVAAVAAVVYLASPPIGDAIRRLGASASAAASALPSGAPLATPSPATTATTSPAATPAPTPTPTTTTAPIPSPAASSQVHVVVKGETLTSIAAQYGVTLAAIKSANAITDVSLIYVGERLVIPPR